MFAFKAKSISEYIADPIASSTAIPLDAVIFVANNEMASYSGISNWSFINISQSDGTPSYVRGTLTVSGAGALYTRAITDSISVVSAGAHGTGAPSFNIIYGSLTPTVNLPINTAAGSHIHSMSGFSSTSSIGGKYPKSVVVGLYKCTTSTKVLPKGSIIFTKSNFIPNLDFVKIDNEFEGFPLLSGSSSWVADHATVNNGIYGEDLSNFTVTPTTIGNSPLHTHDLSTTNSMQAPLQYSTGWYDPQSTTGGSHTHPISSVIVSTAQRLKLFTAYKTIKDTGIYRGMILGWAGTNASTLPTGWYICNGQTVNGITTPIMNETYSIGVTSYDNLNESKTGDDLMTMSYSIGGGGASTHTHGEPFNVKTANIQGVRSNYHKSFAWNHTHAGSTSNICRQGFYTLNFIIYLG